MMQQDKQVSALLEKDILLVAVFKSSMQRMSQSLRDCKNDITCFSQSLQFSDSVIIAVGNRIAMLYQPGNALDKLLRQHIIPSGTYVLFQKLPLKDLLVKAWEQDARGINFAIAVYAAGNSANYPNIDSIAFNVKDNAWLWWQQLDTAALRRHYSKPGRCIYVFKRQCQCNYVC